MRTRGLRGVRWPRRGSLAALGPWEIWLATLTLGALTVGLVLGPLRGVHLSPTLDIPFPVLLLAFIVAEIMVVHVHFTRNAHSLSLSEIAIVLGLFSVVHPTALIIAHALGAAVVLVVYRRQAPFRLGFNVAMMAFTTACGLTVFQALGGGAAATQEEIRWAAAAAGVVAAGLTASILVLGAIFLVEREFHFGTLPLGAAFSTASALANTGIGLLVVALASARPSGLFLLVVPVLVLFLTYRAYTHAREKYESTELLYESTRLLNEGRELDGATVALLTLARRTFRAEVTQLLLPSPDGDVPARRTQVGPGERVETLQPVPISLDDEPWASLARERSASLMSGATPEDRAQIVDLIQMDLRGAMVAPLMDEDRLLGFLTVAGRLGQVGSFGEVDLRLFSLVAAQLAAALEHGRLERSLAQLEALERELSHRAHHDPLTGLANRTLFRDRVSAALARTDRVSAVAFVDLDDFKTVNDSLGHQAGDELLGEVAGRIAGAVRDGDVTARLGGDEFALLLEDVAGLDEAREIADRVLTALKAPVVLGRNAVEVHASIGIALSDGAVEATEILRNADTAMYSAKADGKGRISVFESGMHLRVMRRLELKGELRKALDSGDQIHVHYQPIVDLASGRIAGAEALVRWRHPVHGDVAPDRFISLAEEDGLVVDLGRRVLEQACQDLASWRGLVGEDRPLSMAVNLSPRQLQHGALVQDVSQALARSQIPPECLVVEITESLVMLDAESSLNRLREIRDLGVRVAIDDFGTGYSSLSYLERLPVQIIKIDRSFIDGIGVGGQRAAVVLAILRLAQSLNLSTVAEGIETIAQYDQLRDLDCPLGQGFLFSEPISSEAFTSLLIAGTSFASSRSLVI